MMNSVEAKDLDAILGLQLSVAWAGERAAEPARLGWWNTDLTDAMAGGDLFSRLLPKTAKWAGLELVREAALRADRLARSKLARPEGVRTLFHFGFALDEALQDRLGHHKRHGRAPQEVFAAVWGVSAIWDKAAFAEFLQGMGPVSVEEVPAGRFIKALAPSPKEAALTLAAGLLPLGALYPLPHGPLVSADQ